MPATIVVPEGAPGDEARRRRAASAASVVALPYDDWWRVLVEGRYDGADGLFVHPVDDARVMAGNGTIGLELLEDLPDLDAVVVPYGGGGLLTGIASAVKAQRPERALLRGRAGDGRARVGRARDGRAGGGRVRPLVGRRRRAAAR